MDKREYEREYELEHELRESIRSTEKKGEKIEKSEMHQEILAQVHSEFRYAYDTYLPWMRDNYQKIKLYVNSNRDKESVGDTLLFSTVDTIVASLYSDQMSADFVPSQSGEDQVADAMRSVAENDYYTMNKSVADYYWVWNACMFGFAPLQMRRWDTKNLTPILEVMNPLTFYNDPDATFVEDMVGYNGLRYYGRQVLKSIHEMKKHDRFMNSEHLEELSTWDSSEIRHMMDAYSAARGDVPQNGRKLVGENGRMVVTEWSTMYEGERFDLEVAGDLYQGTDMSCVIKMELSPYKVKWPLVNRQLFPFGPSFRGVSVVDLVEDKQRISAKFVNLSLKSAEFRTYGMYTADKNKVKLEEIGKPAPNKIIGVNGDTNGAIQPINTQGVTEDVNWVLGLLESSAQKATATPAIAQGLTPDNSRSATEIATQNMGIDKRYSLKAKIFGWSEKALWELWQDSYEKYFPKTADKIVRIETAVGAMIRSLKKKDFMSDPAPQVFITSKVQSEIQRATDLQNFSSFMNVVMQDPAVRRVPMYRRFAELSNLTVSEQMQLIPPTPEEIHAEMENDKLEKGEFPTIKITDDHMTHIEIHGKLDPTLPKVKAHINAHKKAMQIVREDPQLIPAPGAVNPGNPSEVNPELPQEGLEQGAQQNFKAPTFFQ